MTWEDAPSHICRGGDVRGLAFCCPPVKPCPVLNALEEVNLTPQEYIQIKKEFGRNKRLGEVFILDRKTGKPLIKITALEGRRNIKVSLISTNKLIPNFKTFESMIKNQITKYQTCIGCSACQSVCRFDALKVVNLQPGSVSQETIKYSIDTKKCVGCLECVTHFDGGCYIKKDLRTKKEG